MNGRQPKKLWMRIVVCIIALIMLLGIIILPLLR